MKIKKNISLRVIIVAMIALILILFALNNFKNTVREEFTRDIYNRLSELSANNAASISSKIDTQFEMMRTMATYLSDEDLKGEKVKSMINKAVDSYGFLRCAISFPDGSFITHDDKTGRDVTQDEFTVKGFEGISSVTGPMPAVADPTKMVILLTEPIYKGKDVVALLTFTYETNYLKTAFNVTGFDGKGYSYITNNDGSIISKPEQGFLDFSGDNILTFFEKQYSKSHTSISSDVASMKSGTVLLELDGRQKYVSYQPLGINQWYVFSVTSAEVLEKQLTSILGSVYVLSVFIIIVILLFILQVGAYIYTIQKKTKKELEKLAYYDSLTGLPNQYMFEISAQKILSQTQNSYAYIILNVNKFKMINEMFGFAQGDKLLSHIASVLKEESTASEVCARFDSDIFHILSVYSSNDDLEKRMLSVAQKISEYSFDKNIPHKVSVGFGAYVIEDNTRSISLMGDKARMALAKVKGIHAPTTYFYNSDIISQFIAEQEIENSMQKALENGEMLVYLQPKCSTETSHLKGAEALVRWQNPFKGIIMPDNFIPLFEKNGFIVKLDMYMVEQVCKKLLQWQEKGLKLITVSVNQSRECLYQPNYISELTSILKKYNMNPAFIEIEVTERAFFEDQTALISVIEQLHWHGFKVAMDDFGTGYSSLNMLQDVNVDVLKIDKNFFRQSINSQRGKKIVTNIISMASDLNIEVVAEGIETKEQLDFLKEIHCESVQGYYFSKPIPPDEFEAKYYS